MSTSLSEGSKVLARCTNYPQPHRYLNMPKPKLSINFSGDVIHVKSEDVVVKGLAFYADDVDGVEFQDNCIDLVPDDEQEIVAKGLNGKTPQFKHYGMIH